MPFGGVKWRSFKSRLSPGDVPVREPHTPPRILDSARRKQLENIRDREENTDKRNRLGKILAGKFIQKLGSEHRRPIVLTIKSYLSQVNNITPQDLEILEQQIRTAISEEASRSATASAAREGGTTTGSNSAINKDGGGTTDTPLSSAAGKEWKILNAYQLVLNEQKIQEEKDNERQKRLKFKAALDHQVKIAQEIKARQQDETKAFDTIVLTDAQRYKEEIDRQQREVKFRHAEEMAAQKHQIEEHRRQREAAEEADRKADVLSVAMARQKLQQEQELIAQNKLKNAQYRARMLEAYAQNNEQRKQEKIRQAAEDARVMQEYAAKLDKQSKEREEGFKKRMDMIEQSANRYMLEGAGVSEREQELRVEKQLVRDMQQREADIIAKEKQKEAERISRNRQALLENARIKEWHKHMEELEQKENDELVRKYREEGLSLKQAEEQSRRQKKAVQLQYSQYLHSQMKPVGRASKDDSMDQRERAINMPTLQKVVADPNVLLRVTERQRPKSGLPPKKSYVAGGNVW